MAGSSRIPGLLLAACLSGGVALFAQPPATAPVRTAERVAFDRWLDGQAQAAIEARRARVAALTTRAAVEARQVEVRQRISQDLGLLPDVQAPLNATVTRTTRRPPSSPGAADGYRIEHVVFESAPGFRVTANAYVPDGPGPFPAVLGTAGHADEGKASPVYQHAWVSLARRGFLVLAYDPFGQGERIEYPDGKGGSRVGIGTREHSMTGQQVLLTGRTVGAYMVRDMRRALDYLVARSDVDPRRLAVAGNSGGGTQAALLGAVEPRLAAVVVSCYMTSWADMWGAPGPQDAEQILPGFVGQGLDFADFALAAAPRGFLVSSAIKDYFPIAGSRAASAELARLYGLLGASDRLGRVENDATHGWTQPLREGAYGALGRWLGRPGATAEAPVATESIADLQVTATGQVATSGGSSTVRELNAAEARALAASRPAVMDATVRQLIGLPASGAGHPARVLSRTGDPAAAEGARLVIESEPGLQIPARLRMPMGSPKGLTLLVAPGGAAGRDDAIRAALAEGQVVLALDVRGTGELTPAAGASGYAGDYQFAARAWLLGTSVVAWQARDMLAGLHVLRTTHGSALPVRLQAAGITTPAALLAAQVDRPTELVLEGGPASYLALAEADTHDQVTLAIVPGILRVTDLPELKARLAPKVRVVSR